MSYDTFLQDHGHEPVLHIQGWITLVGRSELSGRIRRKRDICIYERNLVYRFERERPLMRIYRHEIGADEWIRPWLVGYTHLEQSRFE